jgi:hypothetical protein
MKQFKTYSDIGSVLVGNDNFSVALQNGYGDGETLVRVYEIGEKVPDGAKFNTSVQGTFNIYNYDCSDRNEEDVVATLSGRFGVYYGYSSVFFEKWENGEMEDKFVEENKEKIDPILIDKYKTGTRVFHESFGKGIVSSVDVENGYIKVDFDSIGRKELALAFAPLTIVEE